MPAGRLRTGSAPVFSFPAGTGPACPAPAGCHRPPGRAVRRAGRHPLCAL